MKGHWIWMVIGCGLPLLLIFLAPSFGIGSGSSLFIFILFMFGIHLFMPHGSHRNGGDNHADRNNKGHDYNQKEQTEKAKAKHEGHQHH